MLVFDWLYRTQVHDVTVHQPMRSGPQSLNSTGHYSHDPDDDFLMKQDDAQVSLLQFY